MHDILVCMKKYLSLLPVAMVCLFIFFPGISSAYFTTNQTATRISDSSILFTITYNFGFQNYDGWLPVGAVRGLQFRNPSPYLGYTIINKDGGTIDLGKTNAIVLSKSQVKDGQYFIPKGTAAVFTFVALMDVSALKTERNIALRVTSLPFHMKNQEEDISAQMNPTELKYYTTPLIILNN